MCLHSSCSWETCQNRKIKNLSCLWIKVQRCCDSKYEKYPNPDPIKELKIDKAALESKNKEQEISNRELVQENSTLQKELEASKRSSNNFEADIERLRSDKTDYKDSYYEISDNLDGAKSKIKSLMAERSEFQNKLEMANSRTNRRSTEAKTLEKQLGSERKRRKKAEANYSSLHDQNKLNLEKQASKFNVKSINIMSDFRELFTKIQRECADTSNCGEMDTNNRSFEYSTGHHT